MKPMTHAQRTEALMAAAAARSKGHQPKHLRGIVVSSEKMRERSLANNKAIRAWADKNAIGTKPATFKEVTR